MRAQLQKNMRDLIGHSTAQGCDHWLVITAYESDLGLPKIQIGEKYISIVYKSPYLVVFHPRYLEPGQTALSSKITDMNLYRYIDMGFFCILSQVNDTVNCKYELCLSVDLLVKSYEVEK